MLCKHVVGSYAGSESVLCLVPVTEGASRPASRPGLGEQNDGRDGCCILSFAMLPLMDHRRRT
jgi:hypothetical protein